MTVSRAMPGPVMTDVARTHVLAQLESAVNDGVLLPGLTLLGGGMETIKMPYLVLGSTVPKVFLIERRNDDGEWDALLFDAPASLDPNDGPTVLAALARIGELAQELTLTALADRAVVPPDLASDDLGAANLGERLWDTLYGFRDLVSPDALN